MVMSRKIATRRMAAFVACASHRPSLIWPLADSSMRTEQNGDIARLEGAGALLLGDRGHNLSYHSGAQAPAEEGQPWLQRGKVECARAASASPARRRRHVPGARCSKRPAFESPRLLYHGTLTFVMDGGKTLHTRAHLFSTSESERPSKVKRRGAREVVPGR